MAKRLLLFASAVLWATVSQATPIAYTGFLLNLFNLIPIGFLDGGAIWRAVSYTWQSPQIRYENGVPVEALPPDREHAAFIATLYFLLATLLLGGLLATRHSGML